MVMCNRKSVVAGVVGHTDSCRVVTERPGSAYVTAHMVALAARRSDSHVRARSLPKPQSPVSSIPSAWSRCECAILS